MTEPRNNTISCGFLAPLPLMTLKPSQKAKQLELKSPAGRQRCMRHLVVPAFGLIGPYETGHAPLTRRSNKAEKKQKASEQGLQMLGWPPFWAGPSRLGVVRPRVIRHTCACLISFQRLTSRSTCLGGVGSAGDKVSRGLLETERVLMGLYHSKACSESRIWSVLPDELHTL